jgi:hypothetical protein
MARTFPNGTNQKVVTGAFSIPSAFSIYYWHKNVDTNGLMWGFAGDVLRSGWSTGSIIALSRVFATSGFVTSTVTPGATLTNWNHWCWTHDGTTAGPTFYINGAPVALTSTWAAAGAADTTSRALTIGCHPTGSFAAGGSQAYYGFHNVVLTQSEVIAAMRFGWTPRGCIGAWPLLGDNPELDISGLKKAGTLTGTTVVAGPPIMPSLIPALV